MTYFTVTCCNNLTYLQGTSTHNQRIERLWVDVYSNVADVYHRLFMTMEEQGILDIDNDFHLYLLHVAYQDIIQIKLTEFQNQYNCHSLRTERGMTPRQLWVSGGLQLINSDSAAIEGMLSNYGVDTEDTEDSDEDGPSDDEIPVYVSPVPCPFSQDLHEDLVRRLKHGPLEAGHSQLSRYMFALEYFTEHYQQWTILSFLNTSDICEIVKEYNKWWMFSKCC